jgi:hypothetical protein
MKNTNSEDDSDDEEGIFIVAQSSPARSDASGSDVSPVGNRGAAKWVGDPLARLKTARKPGASSKG